MASHKLKRKSRKNVFVGQNKSIKIKRLNAKPVIKNIDIEELKKSFEKTAKEEAPKKKAAAKKVEKEEAPKAAAKVEEVPVVEEKVEKKAPKKAAKKEDKSEE
ncbi:MAG: hypothetical protein KTR26_03045 [Flammeovirgaceae bacterium]|nr:hypothetical protein [Flammeovirgaceae bacterium]